MEYQKRLERAPSYTLAALYNLAKIIPIKHRPNSQAHLGGPTNDSSTSHATSQLAPIDSLGIHRPRIIAVPQSLHLYTHTRTQGARALICSPERRFRRKYSRTWRRLGVGRINKVLEAPLYESLAAAAAIVAERANGRSRHNGPTARENRIP